MATSGTPRGGSQATGDHIGVEFGRILAQAAQSLALTVPLWSAGYIVTNMSTHRAIAVYIVNAIGILGRLVEDWKPVPHWNRFLVHT